ncbi:MAG TPA: hypothetical protein VH418_10330 [Solirubrobacteraceae bacterium]|jgi:hypothetical protein
MSIQEAIGLAHWRAEHLRAAGFDDVLARRLALDRRYDLHALIELVERGCPPKLAARILAPLDEEHDEAC